MNQVGAEGQCHSNDDSAVPRRRSRTTSRSSRASRPTRRRSSSPAIAGVDHAVRDRAPRAAGRRHGDSRRSRTRARTRASNAHRGRRPADPHQAVPRLVPEPLTFTTICQQDLSGGLQLIAQLLKTRHRLAVHRRQARRRRPGHRRRSVRLLGVGRPRTTARRTRTRRCCRSATTRRRRQRRRTSRAGRSRPTR